MNGRETSIKNPAKKRLAQLVDALLGGLVRTGRLLGMNRPRRGGLAPERIARILVVRLDHIGDVIMTTPVLRLLKERYPEGMVTCLVASWGKAVVENNPYLDELLIYDAPWWKKSRPEGGRRGLLTRGENSLACWPACAAAVSISSSIPGVICAICFSSVISAVSDIS